MGSKEHVMLFPSFDNQPGVQAEIPRLWLPYGLNVEIRSPNPTSTDYEEWLERTGEEIVELAEEEEGVNLVGNSNGGKIALSLITRHPDLIRRVMICNTKIGPYKFNNPKTREKVPNLAEVSDVLEEDRVNLTEEMLGRTLCFRSLEDDVLDDPTDAELEGANNLVTPTYTHSDGISYVAENCGLVVAKFFQDGTIPDSV